MNARLLVVLSCGQETRCLSLPLLANINYWHLQDSPKVKRRRKIIRVKIQYVRYGMDREVFGIFVVQLLGATKTSENERWIWRGKPTSATKFFAYSQKITHNMHTYSRAISTNLLLRCQPCIVSFRCHLLEISNIKFQFPIVPILPLSKQLFCIMCE